MKTEVYSWRLAGELKSDLERQARLRRVPVSSILDTAVREWLQKINGDSTGNEAHAGFMPPLRIASGPWPGATRVALKRPVRPFVGASAVVMHAEALIDTGAILALLDKSDRWHQPCVTAFAQLRLPLLTSEAVLTELFHLVGD